MNKIVLIGRLTKDPELRFTPGKGTAVTTFTIAGIAQCEIYAEFEEHCIPEPGTDLGNCRYAYRGEDD